ncbi:MAG: alpha/beta hydrolase family esterase, partial [Opitutaceae bacterium]
LDRIATEYRVDAHRVFVAGFSNGASMAFRIAAELPQRIAAIAPVAGSCWMENLPAMGGVSICYLSGTADPLNPLEGGYPRLATGGADQGGKPKPPVRVTMEKWIRALGCPETPAHEARVNGVHLRRHGTGRDGATVEFITVEDLGHVWPGGNAPAPAFLVGHANDRLNATDTVWDFFRAHPASPEKRPGANPHSAAPRGSP